MVQLVSGLALAFGCTKALQQSLDEPPRPVARDAGAEPDAGADAADFDAAETPDAEPEPDDPMALHQQSREGLLALFTIQAYSDKDLAKLRPDLFLNHNFGPSPSRMSQGNKSFAHHEIGKRACLEGLSDVVLQTEGQRERCGAANMVPIFNGGDEKSATTCVDVFEFPNQACELPIVWAPPTHAATLCALQGKRLCTQAEWQLACRGDPAGGPDRRYAYGETLDLSVCNTLKKRVGRCNPRTAELAYESCGTDTEPSGAFPQCHSRFGVYDQHGNVAEIMTRKEKKESPGDKDRIVTQLKGSAFFYSEVSRYTEPEYAKALADKEPLPRPSGDRETYPDHCNYDPRWHVEPIEAAWHVNYHLGFRCCKTVAPAP